MANLDSILERIQELEQKVERLNAVVEIQNLMGRYETLLVPQTMDRVADEVFASWMEDVSMEVSDRGVFVGIDAVRHLFSICMGPCNEPQINGAPDFRGALYLHHINTPMIEVAEDCKTAHAVWYSSGVETPYDKTAECRMAKWCWGKYSVEFIRGDCGWRIWHMHWFRGFMNNYGKSWVEDYANDTRDTTDREKLGVRVLPTTFHRPYNPHLDVIPVPRNPEPYQTHEDSSWIYGHWLDDSSSEKLLNADKQSW